MSGAASSEIPESRFTPGTIVAGRYRLLSLLGRGGMGEVYRADDLTLGQQVALKFLPEALTSDRAGLAAFHNEVRLARQIAHPNVCRVYDIGTLEGMSFLSMEYVDGEDLASLLRRIGELPGHKALELARQLCAGLAAAHGQGVLHRDLKPTNVMIDGRGQARIMDFGLAGIADRMTEADVFAGTPSCMAPEQLAGIEVTTRSDIYALGLVLYEMVTGRPAIAADSLIELIRRHQEEPPKRPSELVEGVDPRFERAIMACLEKDPALRPPSALALSAMLPGSDPLAAALAAGQTPSPEMVAEAGGVAGVLSVRRGWLALGALLGSLGLLLALSGEMTVYRRSPLPKPPAVLADRAQEILATVGAATPPAMIAHGFELRKPLLDWMARHRSGPDRWKPIETGWGPAIGFWYRSNRDQENVWKVFQFGRVASEDPPLFSAGNALVRLDPSGHLRSLLLVPGIYDTLESRGPTAWAPLFAAAGLDSARFRRIAPPLIPRTFADERVAWEEIAPEDSAARRVVQGAALRGRPVQFRLIDPWERADAPKPGRPSAAARTLSQILTAFLILAVVVGGFTLGFRNVRRGNVDLRGARRLAWFSYLCGMFGWLCGAHHFLEVQLEMNSFVYGSAAALLMFGFVWGSYVALEPTVRRVWPHFLIGWTRLLSGRFDDPLVGRDILTGAAFGMGYLLLRTLVKLLLWKTSGALPHLDAFDAETLAGGGVLGLVLASCAFQVLQGPMIILVIMVVLRLVLRNRLAALVATAVLLVTPPLLEGDAFSRIDGVLLQSMLIAVLLRSGVLSLMTTMAFVGVVTTFPVTLDTSAWYFGSGAFGLAVLVALVGYGAHTAVGRRLSRANRAF